MKLVTRLSKPCHFYWRRIIKATIIYKPIEKTSAESFYLLECIDRCSSGNPNPMFFLLDDRWKRQDFVDLDRYVLSKTDGGAKNEIFISVGNRLFHFSVNQQSVLPFLDYSGLTNVISNNEKNHNVIRSSESKIDFLKSKLSHIDADRWLNLTNNNLYKIHFYHISNRVNPNIRYPDELRILPPISTATDSHLPVILRIDEIFRNETQTGWFFYQSFINTNRKSPICYGESDDRHQSILSAFGEGYERYCGNSYDRWINIGNDKTDESKSDYKIYSADDFGVYSDEQNEIAHSYDIHPQLSNANFDYFPGRNLVTTDRVLVPKNFVFCSYNVERRFVEEDSTGTASHTDPMIAIQHGLVECIERDAILDSWNNNTKYKKIITDTISESSILTAVQGLKNDGANVDIYIAPNPASLPVAIIHISRKLTTAGYVSVVGSGAGWSIASAIRSALGSTIRKYIVNENLKAVKRLPLKIVTPQDHCDYFLNPDSSLKLTKHFNNSSTYDFLDLSNDLDTNFHHVVDRLNKESFEILVFNLALPEISKSIYVYKTIVKGFHRRNYIHDLPHLNIRRLECQNALPHPYG